MTPIIHFQLYTFNFNPMHPYLTSYALEPETTITQIKKGLYSERDPTVFFERLNTNKVNWHRHEEKEFHYKFNLISPKVQLYYYQGDLSLLNQDILAIVGPRKMSKFWEKTLEELFDIAKNYRLVTISGLAPGTDQYAHKLSLQHNIPTIAILGGGIERFSRSNSNPIIQKIINNWWLIISEYKPNFEPTRYSFPQRNRIIAGLSNIVFIPEAWQKSGSLITANFANQMKKPIYGTPNHIYAPQHKGLLEYIANKKISLCIDIKKTIHKHFSPQQQNKIIENLQLTDTEKHIIKQFHSGQTQNIQTLSQITKIPSHQLITITSILEIKGLLYQTSPGTFSRKK